MYDLKRFFVNIVYLNEHKQNKNSLSTKKANILPLLFTDSPVKFSVSSSTKTMYLPWLTQFSAILFIHIKGLNDIIGFAFHSVA